MPTTVLRTHGFLEISRETINDQDIILISFFGDKKSDMDDVEAGVDYMYGTKKFAKMQKVAEYENGDPSWAYRLVLRADRFFKIIGHESYSSVVIT